MNTQNAQKKNANLNNKAPINMNTSLNKVNIPLP